MPFLVRIRENILNQLKCLPDECKNYGRIPERKCHRLKWFWMFLICFCSGLASSFWFTNCIYYISYVVLYKHVWSTMWHFAVFSSPQKQANRFTELHMPSRFIFVALNRKHQNIECTTKFGHIQILLHLCIICATCMAFVLFFYWKRWPISKGNELSNQFKTLFCVKICIMHSLLVAYKSSRMR